MWLPERGSRLSLCWLKTAKTTRTPQDQPMREYHPSRDRTTLCTDTILRPDYCVVIPIGVQSGWAIQISTS
jgi:hypothetical protein